MRRSPISFAVPPARTESRDGWQVVLEYEDEGEGPYMVDLSHCPRWDLQAPFEGLEIPEEPGECLLNGAVLVNRMNRTQVSVCHLDGQLARLPVSPSFTDMTDATAFFALLGRNVFAVTEQLTNLDLGRPGRTPPFLLQGPFSHVPCQVVVLASSGVLVACPRGYGQDITRSVLHAGEPLGLRPAGEDALRRYCLR